MTGPVVRVERLPEAPDLPYRLGRHLAHDPRSRAFAFTAPERVELRDVAWRRRVDAYDQNGLGSCTANALCGALSTTPHRHRFRSQRNIVKVYSAATAIDPFPGSYTAPSWEDTGSSGLAVAKVALSKGWISRYEHIFRWDDFLQAMMVGPVIVGTAWHDGMFRTDPTGQIRPVGAVVGGHEYEAFGVDVPERRVWFFNSWGEGWGVKGRFWISWDNFRNLLADDGDATVLVP